MAHGLSLENRLFRTYKFPYKGKGYGWREGKLISEHNMREILHPEYIEALLKLRLYNKKKG